MGGGLRSFPYVASFLHHYLQHPLGNSTANRTYFSHTMSDPLHHNSGTNGHSPGSTHRELEKPDTRFHDLEANRAITRSRDGDGDLGSVPGLLNVWHSIC